MSQRKTKPKSTTGKSRKPAEKKAPKPSNEPKILGGVLVTVVAGPKGEGYRIEAVEGTNEREIPTLLRIAANVAEKRLVGE